MKLELLPQTMSVCKLAAYPAQPLLPPCFLSVTDKELSLVCPAQQVPADALAVKEGFRALRIAGQLDFSLVGVLHALLAVLAEGSISVFTVSTFDTDYVLVREARLGDALRLLTAAGHEIVSLSPVDP